jgi:hypothetical protein
MRLSERAIQAGAVLYAVIDVYHLAFLAHFEPACRCVNDTQP